MRTTPIFGEVIAVEHLVEGEQVEKIVVREEGIVNLAVEVTDGTHLLVGIQQPAVRGIEGEADDGMLENLLIAFGQGLLFLLLLMELGLVNQCTDDADGLFFALSILGNAGVVQIAPTRLATRVVEIPPVVELHAPLASRNECPDVSEHGIEVVWMNMLLIVFETETFVGQHVSAQLAEILTGDIIDNDIVGTNLQRFHHQVVGGERAPDATTEQTAIYRR